MNGKGKQPTILVIFGITGDLARRYLIPAIEDLANAGALPNHYKVIGITRRNISQNETISAKDYPNVSQNLEIYQMVLEKLSDYEGLKNHLEEIAKTLGADAQKLFYLSVPPQVSQTVIQMLGEAGFGKKFPAKLLLEKPFGADLDSAEELIEHIKRYFDEEQVYRIDHYMAKEMAQNIVYFRAGNSLLKRTWNKDFIESIEIIASEEIGIEGRANFYEQTGALRDVVQSHLMQLAALTLMHLPDWNNLDAVPYQRLIALKYLNPPEDIKVQVVRGQYDGYRKEVNNPDSDVETFIKLTLYSNDPKWHGVPISLITGKKLNRRFTGIRIKYRQEDAAEANVLILRIQPNEGAEIRLWSKQPGFEHELKKMSLDFSYKNHFAGLPNAYERVIVDAMRSDRTLFTTSEEVLASWRILKPIQEYWDKTDSDLIVYKPGSNPKDIS